jgi:hypothetical protein
MLKRTVDAERGPSAAVAAAAIFGRYFYTPEFLKACHRRRILATLDHVVAGCLLGLYEEAGLSPAPLSVGRPA